jgi:alginate O-acetyltransferase complex protein AlgI
MPQEVFFWAFLAGAVALYWIAPLRIRSVLLGLISLVFMAAYDWLSTCFILLMSSVLFLALPAIAARDRRAVGALLAMLVLLAGPLIFFKFTSTLDAPLAGIPAWVVPLGMSYYVFRLIQVAVDAYRTGRHPASAADFFSYAFLFTIFAAGPIQRYEPFLEGRTKHFDVTLLMEGVMRIAVGLIKQGFFYYALLGLREDAFGWQTPREMMAGIGGLGTGELWLLLVFTYLGAYLNLSAYTDIAIGASRLFGFRITENFAYPVAATSLDDFWRRWHITLSSWCQTYVYSLVLGAARNPYIAIIASFQVMGLWHMLTLNRFGWGLFQATGLIILFAIRRSARKRNRKRTEPTAARIALGWLFTQAFVTASFVFVINEKTNDLWASLHLLLRLIGIG